jgi:hypothetical protein
MRPENPRRERHLRVQPEPDAGPVPLQGNDRFVFTEAVVRAGWSMRLHALLGEEVARAVGAGVLTVAEAEVLLARLAVVIDQAVGASDR